MTRIGIRPRACVLATAAALAIAAPAFSLASLAPASASAASGTARPATSRPATASAPAPDWIIGQSALVLLSQAGPMGKNGLTSRQLQVLFGNARTFVVHPMRASAPVVHGARLTVSFASYQTLKATIDGPGLPPGTRAVIYDNEHWSLTPVAEQRDPAKYEKLAAALVHAHHLLFISTPAVDLTDVLAPHDTNHLAAYLRLGVAASAARYADAIDIQAQSSIADLATYVPFVKAAAAQARNANRHVVVLAGLSTNPSGQKVTSKQFTAAFDAARPYVTGYWLNIPAGGTACPKCGTPRPQVALPLLRSLLNP